MTPLIVLFAFAFVGKWFSEVILGNLVDGKVKQMKAKLPKYVRKNRR